MILPLARTPLSAAALVIGSVSPICILVYAVWQLLFRAPIVDLSPSWLRQRMPRQSPAPWRDQRGTIIALLLSLAAFIVGTLTHLLWDSFTHPGWVVDRIAVLRYQVGPLPIEKWLQYASTVGGFVIVGVWAAWWYVLRASAERRRPYPESRRNRPE